MKITVHGTKASRAMRVLWMLEELDLPYEHRPSKPHDADIRALTPSGKIPVIEVDGDILTDSVAIMAFLADRTGALTHPAGTAGRARQDAVTQRICEVFDAPLWAAAMHSFVLPEDRRTPEVKPAMKAQLVHGAEALAAEVGDRLEAGGWLAGAAFTVPDILLSHCMGWARIAKFPDLPAPLVAHMKRSRERPAFQRAAARD